MAISRINFVALPSATVQSGKITAGRGTSLRELPSGSRLIALIRIRDCLGF